MIGISSIMSKKPVTTTTDNLLRDVIKLMDKHGYKEIPVIDGDNKVKGIISYFDILNIIRFRGDSKVSNFMTSTHTLKPKDKVEDVLNLMINSGCTGFPVADHKNKIVGFVSDHDILNYYLKEPLIKNLKVSEANVKTVNPVLENSKIGEVRVIMQFNKRDRLPVVDKKGKFIGTILLLDLLRSFYLDSPNKIGRGFNPGTSNLVSKKLFIKGDLSKIMRVSIEGLVRPDVHTRLDSKLTQAMRTMLSNNLLGLIVLNSEEEPLGVLDRCSVLKKIHSMLTEKGISVDISGELPSGAVSEVKNIISNTFKLLPRHAKSLKGLKLFVKRVHDSNSEGKVEMHLRVIRDGRDLIIKKTGYDVLFTLVECLDKANQLLKQEMRNNK